jgi:hypothetical protein
MMPETRVKGGVYERTITCCTFFVREIPLIAAPVTAAKANVTEKKA